MSNEAAVWFYSTDDQRKGPFSREQISALLSVGAITEHTRVWSETLSEWTPLFKTELRALLGERPVPPPDIAATPAASTQSPGVASAASAPAAASYALYGNRTLATLVQWASFACVGMSAMIIMQTLKQNTVEQKLAKLRLFQGDQWSAIGGVLFLVTAILFLTWKYRATANLFNLAGPQSVTPAGAVYWYFVPVAWFWKPYEAMRNLWYGLNSGARNNFSLYAWWTVFWIGNAAGIFTATIAPEQITTIPAAEGYIFWSVVVLGLDAAFFALAADLVKKISDAESRALAVRGA